LSHLKSYPEGPRCDIYQGVDKLYDNSGEGASAEITDRICMARRLFRKAVQQGRSKRRGDAYSLPYVEPLSAARTPLADFINSLLAISGRFRDPVTQAAL
jgi:hypothetical protein